MSYNGIGLSTARGSGTNGYIQKNYTRSSESSYSKRQKNKLNDLKRDQLVSGFKDQELVKHEEKRELDLKVSEYRDRLEDGDGEGDGEEELSDGEIEARCKKFREELVKEMNAKRGYKSRKSREEKPARTEEEPVDY